MRSIILEIIVILNFIRCIPHLIVLYFHKNRRLIEKDMVRWQKIKKLNYSNLRGLIYLLAFFPEFRNLLYNRLGYSSHFLNIICPQLSTLNIHTKDIGEGFYINHGTACDISAISIGKNCKIHQQISIGNYNGFPTILDNVTIYAGAVIIGKITIGNNVVIGANATVYEDIPDDCTVFAPPSRIISWKKSEKKLNINQTAKP